MAGARLEFRILGPVEVLRNGADLKIGPRKERLLLARLLLNASRVVSADQLIEDLWAGRPPSGAAKTLRSYVSHLRGALGGDIVKGRPPGYVLDIEPEQVDARRFESLLRDGRDARSRGEAEEASVRLREGLDLWRGGALADLIGEPFAGVEARRLEELRFEALEERIQADLDRGGHLALVAELEALVAEFPMRERLWAQLMTSLYRSGRQADALAAYRRARGLLAEELGLEVGEELRELEQSILRQELGAAPTPEAPRQLPGGTVTLLFTDIEGSTSLLQELGNRYAEVLAEHRRVLREAFSLHGGIEIEAQGDAFFVVFPGANNAIAAAVAAQDGLASGPVRVRMGIHTGEPDLTEDGYVGAEVHRAARIMAAGHGGQVLLSQATRELIEAGVSVRDLGDHHLRDLVEPHRLYQLGDDDFPPLRTLHRTNLPVQLTSFIGRERECEELDGLLADTSLVTLCGVGGCGKTRLAVEVAGKALHRFPDGVFFVELAGLTDSEFVPHAVAAALRSQERSERSVVDMLADRLRSRTLLLILDNCEHLLDACADLATALLSVCPDVRIVATSREPLGLPGELVYRVPALSVSVAGEESVSDAVRLFVERATAASGRELEWSSETLATVVAICRELDGLPLALELAAARTHVLTVQEIADRLDDRFRFLRYWRRSPQPRHETLGATMAWSYELLSPPERALLRRLAVFASGFTFDAAASVCQDCDPEASLALLTRLVDTSLVHAEPTDGKTRYQMLETVRRYAGEQLDEAGETDEARRRHAAYFLELAERQWDGIDAPTGGSWWTALEEGDNLRGALEWYVDGGHADAAHRFICWLTWFWERTDRLAEGRRWCERVLALDGEIADLSRAQAFYAVGSLSWLMNDFGRAEQFLEKSMSLFKELDEKLWLARVLEIRAGTHFVAGELGAARAGFEASMELFGNLSRPGGVAAAMHGLGQVYRDLGDRETARSLLVAAVDVYREMGDEVTLAAILHSIGDLELDEGNFAAAAKRYREGLAIAKQVGMGLRTITYCLAGLSATAGARGNVETAGHLWGAVERLEDEMGVTLHHVERVRYEQLLAAVVSEPTFQEAQLAGRDLRAEEAVVYAGALEESSQVPPARLGCFAKRVAY